MDFYLLPLDVVVQVWHLLLGCFGGLPCQPMGRFAAPETLTLFSGTAAILSHLTKPNRAKGTPLASLQEVSQLISIPFQCLNKPPPERSEAKVAVLYK